MTRPLAVSMPDVDAACHAMGTSDEPASAQQAFIQGGTLHVVVASTGQAMTFAGALASRMILTELSRNGGELATAAAAAGDAADLAGEIMIHASDAPRAPCPPGYMVICFPGITVEPGDPGARRAAARGRLARGGSREPADLHPAGEHLTELNPSGASRLRKWLGHPSGGLGMGRVTFEAVAGGGVLVRTVPHPGARRPVTDRGSAEAIGLALAGDREMLAAAAAGLDDDQLMALILAAGRLKIAAEVELGGRLHG